MQKIHITFIVFLLIFNGCNQKKDNKSVTFSTDKEELSHFINIDTYKPDSVRFQYIYIDNSGQNQRLSVPGPSDNFLSGILYYDSLTFASLLHNYRLIEDSIGIHDKKQFSFQWLDNSIRSELAQSSTIISWQDSILKKDIPINVCILYKKILFSN